MYKMSTYHNSQNENYTMYTKRHILKVYNVTKMHLKKDKMYTDVRISNGILTLLPLNYQVGTTTDDAN